MKNKFFLNSFVIFNIHQNTFDIVEYMSTKIMYKEFNKFLTERFIELKSIIYLRLKFNGKKYYNRTSKENINIILDVNRYCYKYKILRS